jgi:PAS domain S-box-containing protein
MADRNPIASATEQDLLLENAQLRAALDEIWERLREPEEVLRAIRQGEVDAVVVEDAVGDQIYWVRKADELYRAMIEDLLPYGVWVSGPDGKIRYVSQSYLDLVGKTMDEIRGFGWTTLLAPDESGTTLQHWLRCVETGERWDSEHKILGADGEYHSVLCRGFPVRTEAGNITCWVGINLDIDKRKKMEERLRQQAAVLAEADRRKDEFLALLGHELRNPLAPMRNALSVLKMTGLEGPVAAQTLEMIDRQVGHMVHLIDDLLDVSRITRGKVRLQKVPVDLSKVIACAVELSTPYIQGRRHQFSMTLPDEAIYLEADLSRMTQVISNLLNNAAKFTPEGGRIALTTQRDDDHVLIKVSDNGEGIAGDVLPHIFDLFVQSPRLPDRSQGGLGIGLTLVRSLVEMHDGSVQAASSGMGQGSEFTVRLPIMKGAPKNAQGENPLQHRSDRVCRRILIVEDNADAASSLALLLTLQGHEVRTAVDGPTAMQIAEAQAPEVVLLDIGLPGGLSGYQVAEWFRQQDSQKPLLLAMTGYGQRADQERSQKAGIDYHLTKPVDLDRLNELLAT